jgi:hypothetical protein
VAEKKFPVGPLPSATLGKGVAECLMPFAESFRPLAKPGFPVVMVCVTYVWMRRAAAQGVLYIYRHIGNAVVSRVVRFGWKTWHNVEVVIITLVQPSQSNSALSSSIFSSKLYIITILSLLSSIDS